MQIMEAYHGKGTGLAMLRFLTQHTGMSGCYCLPYQYLRSFYGQIGFKEISAVEAPPFLAQKLEKYLGMGLEVILMKIKCD